MNRERWGGALRSSSAGGDGSARGPGSTPTGLEVGIVRALIQRVIRARAMVGEHASGEIGHGLLILLGATHGDEAVAAEWLAHKIGGLRVFEDAEGKINLDLKQVGGAVLVVPQFTLYGDARRGRRPDFVRAAPPDEARELFECFCRSLADQGIPVQRGVFREHMDVELTNDGPLTLLLESPPLGGDGW